MSNLKKVVALAMALALVLTMFASATIKTDLPFKDVAEFTDEQKSAAALLNPLGILSGIGADELGAGGLTRAQMVTFVYRLVNGGDYGVQNYYSKTSIFPDVDPEAWYAPYINWAYAAKVVEGYGTNFGPEDPVTGVQAAAMLVRLLGKDDARGADYALKTQAYAIGFGLDTGIETQGLYEKELARGDMFILLANTLMTPVKGETIAEKIFDLEIINGAILLGMDHIGSNGYSVFAFRTETDGDVKYFWTDLLCVEEDSAVFDDYGCKYTLLVSKDQINAPTYNQGYRWLYAAYEETQNNYYKVVTGTVDDGTMKGEKGVLVYTKDGKAVPLDKNVFVYVNGKAATVADFIASLGVANMARYKLIDNDGDGAYEFIIVERYALKDIATETINAKVTAVSANGRTITLTKADGTAVTVKLGQFWDAKYAAVTNNDAKIQNALGINQQNAGAPYFGGYMPFTAISDVYYDFVIGGGYLFDMKVSDNTKFSGSYGIMVAWSSPITFYKNMPYALFVNEKSEYFWAYVQTVDEAPAMTNWTFVLANTLVYFTDGDASDDVVSFDTAGFWNSNYTYKELMLAFGAKDNAKNPEKTVKFTDTVWSVITDKTKSYNFLKNADNTGAYNKVYAIFDFDPADPKGDGSVPAIRYWDSQAETETDCPAGTAFSDALDRKIDNLPVLDYKELKGKYYVPVDETSYYGIRALAECKGFIYVTGAEMKITMDNGAGTSFPEELQIYRRNGFWHLRFYTLSESVAYEDIKAYLTVNGKDYELKMINGIWSVELDDEGDPGIVGDEEVMPVREIIKGFDAAQFEEQVRGFKNELVARGGAIERSGYTLLNTAHGVVFAYGDVVEEGATVRRWVAYDIDTFDADFGYGDPFYDVEDEFGRIVEVPNDTVPFGYTADELIYAKVGGTMYVKALKVSDYMGTLPYGWLAPNGYELVVFGGFAGGVNTDGWGIKLITFDGDKINAVNVFTKIGLGGAVAGDVLLVKRDANGNLTELLAVGDTVWGYLDYATGYRFLLADAPLVSATKIAGDDYYGDYYEVNLTGKTVYYMWTTGTTLHWDTDFSKVPQEKGKTPYVSVWSVGNVYVAFVEYYA